MAVAMAKGRVYDDLYARLETKEGEKELYRLARQRDRARENVQYVGIMKDKYGNVMVNLEALNQAVILIFQKYQDFFYQIIHFFL